MITCGFESDERLSGLIGPGGPFELEDVVVDGVPLRSFRRAPASLIDVFECGQAHQDKTSLVYGADRLTFGDVRAQALSIARYLKADCAVGQGDRVAVAMRNYPEFVIAFWAATVLGAIPVALNSWWTGPELAAAMDDSGAKVIFADAERIERLRSVPGRWGTVPMIGVRTGDTVCAHYDDVVFGRPLGEAEFARVAPNDVAAVLYTSGTTGQPKGVMITHRGAVANVMNMAFSSIRDSVIGGTKPSASTDQPSNILATPLFHTGGMAAMIGGSLGGSKMVLMHRWDVDEALELVRRERVTATGGVPTIAREILEHPDIGTVRQQITTFSIGAASVSPELPRLARRVLGESVRLVNGYGLTETTSAVISNVGTEYVDHPGSVGKLNLTADLRVLAPDGEVLGVDEVGELCFRSPQVARGYWNNPAATAESFSDGWFRSGDLGYVNRDGYVFVVDRLKDVIIRGGENVYCSEVEVVLFEHPAVLDVVVMGIPDDVMGERVCAVVVARPGTTPELPDLREFAAARLASFKHPEALHVVDVLPRTATGKIVKKALREQLSAVWLGT